MAEMRDAYGNPVRVDEYGNPVVHDQQRTAGGAGYGAVGGDIGREQHQHGKQHHGVSGMLHRSGSSSSSSSEEDEGGVRRKKGVKERVKEKIPGVGHKGEESHPGATTYSHQQQQQYGQAGEHHQGEKKGVMEKIKEKLPGTHHH